ncbi:MAG: anaerobic sulfatase maturase [Dehalococcoidia bacterium]|nr:anaerobic sulfatase maturase [Dehalococcoidia bacterium]
MPPLSVMFKTVSTDCNLDCHYCYYRESLQGSRAQRRIENEVLERFIPEYMEYVADVRQANIAWQGGEPTLAGLPFFQRVVQMQEQHAAPGTVISNAIQTNAVLVDDAWGTFFAQYAFLVGVSLDGPQEIHDQMRIRRGGQGSFRDVMRGIEVLRRYNVDLNILCVLGPHNIERVGDLMRFFRGEGFSHVQFIPAMDFQAIEPEKPVNYLISPEAYGEFLVVAFDSWFQGGGPTISVRIFDNFLQSYVNVPNDLCVHSNSCEAGIVVEWDGSAYPCDFYIHPAWKLGNVLDRPLSKLVNEPRRIAFVLQKIPLPMECVHCEWLSVCRGGCPRNRMGSATAASPDYFCRAYLRFFPHAHENLRSLGRDLERYREYVRNRASGPRGRNEPCPCGSGKKRKQCCEHPHRQQSYVFHQ